MVRQEGQGRALALLQSSHCSSRLRNDRKYHLYLQPSPDAIAKRNVPAVAPNHGLGRRQSEPHAARHPVAGSFQTEKGGEHLIERVGWNAGTWIADQQDV